MEWEAAHRRDLVERNVYNPDDYDLGHDVEPIDGAHDLFGDGRIVCVPTEIARSHLDDQRRRAGTRQQVGRR